jgi:hypothetical protein
MFLILNNNLKGHISWVTNGFQIGNFAGYNFGVGKDGESISPI